MARSASLLLALAVAGAVVGALAACALPTRLGAPPAGGVGSGTPEDAAGPPAPLPVTALPVPEGFPTSEGVALPLALRPEQVTVDAWGLGGEWHALVVPATAFDTSRPAGPTGLPEHIQIRFGDATGQLQPRDPRIYIVPVNHYRLLWSLHGALFVSDAIDWIERLAVEMPEPTPSYGLPALPFELSAEGWNDLVVYVGSPATAAGTRVVGAAVTGYRFVGRWADESSVVTNEGLWYVFQGFTNDGQYLVAVWVPVRTEELPPSPEQVPPEELATAESDYEGYMVDMVERLDKLAPDRWTPDLRVLDRLATSLRIAAMPQAGLQALVWEWIEGPVQAGTAVSTTIQSPALYRVQYGTEGDMAFQADCTSGSQRYRVSTPGLVGQIEMLGAAALGDPADCGPASHAAAFVRNLADVEGYRLLPGGTLLHLYLAGDQVMVLQPVGASAP